MERRRESWEGGRVVCWDEGGGGKAGRGRGREEGKEGGGKEEVRET